LTICIILRSSDGIVAKQQPGSLNGLAGHFAVACRNRVRCTGQARICAPVADLPEGSDRDLTSASETIRCAQREHK
jgi:hypothetical protein